MVKGEGKTLHKFIIFQIVKQLISFIGDSIGEIKLLGIQYGQNTEIWLRRNWVTKKTANGEITGGKGGQEDPDGDQPGMEWHCSTVSSIFEWLSLKKG